MTIESLSTRIVELPLPRPVGTAIHQMKSVGCVLVTLRTTDGVEGEGFAFTLNGDRIKAFDEMVSGMAHFVEGRDAIDVGAVNAAIWRDINPTGHKGVTIAALAAIDTALWDIVGKQASLPLAKLFGGVRDTVPTYASSGLWLSQSIDELVEESAGFVTQGFRGMKIRIGSTDPADDLARVAAVRDAVGPDIELYVDANQGLSPKQAIRLAAGLEQFGLVWFEEPVVTHDLEGSARVRDAISIDVAAGETEYTSFGMFDLLRSGAVDLLMPDLQRVGGFSEFRRAADVAWVHNTPVSSHFFTEYSLSLAGSLANCVSVEHIDWFTPLFNEDVELRDGELVIPDRPGTGFTFRT